jgi:hypothetical protein
MSELLKPPADPAAILNFFASQPDFCAVAGDISEEFHQRAQSSGANAAKRWYWHEAFRNAFALTWRELMRTPFRTFGMTLACFLAVNIVTVLYLVVRYYPLEFLQDPVELVSDHNLMSVLVLLNFIASLTMGWIGGRLLPGREWALALTYTLVTACVTLPGAWYLLFVLKQNPPATVREAMIVGHALRQSTFWLGSLWSRYVNNRKHSSIVSAAKSA